jgi:hypothetical protein
VFNGTEVGLYIINPGTTVLETNIGIIIHIDPICLKQSDLRFGNPVIPYSSFVSPLHPSQSLVYTNVRGITSNNFTHPGQIYIDHGGFAV